MQHIFLKFTSLLFFISLIVQTAHAQSLTLNKNLRQGDTGADVYQLQIFLNKDLRTRIASQGPGSPGSETNYFGALTLDAVRRFQSLYSQDVLQPAGLVVPSGYVGPLTRAKIQALTGSTSSQLSTTPSSISTSQSSTNVTPAQVKDAPKLHSLSQYYVTANTPVTVYGSGFTANNTVNVGPSFRIDALSSPDGNTLVFTSPNLEGSFNLWISNENGVTLDGLAPPFFNIGSTSQLPPQINSVSPEVIRVRSVENITITGSGFDSENNTVISTMGTVENIPSQNNTLIIPVRNFDGFRNLASPSQFSGTRVPVQFFVKNRFGITKNAGIVNIEI